MFRSLRWRLLFSFVGITAFVFVILTLFSRLLFNAGLNVALDSELQALASEILPAINVEHNPPELAPWIINIRNEPRKLLATIQLFDANGLLLEQRGPNAYLELMKGKKENHNVIPSRVYVSPLKRGGKLIGYLQIQLPTTSRNHAVAQFGWTMAYIAPLLLVALGFAGWLFSGYVIRPMVESFEILQRFMGDAGHELGTPISIIQVNAEALESELSDKNIKSNRLEVIFRSTERMSNLVKDLILLSKMASPQVAFAYGPVGLNDCVSEVLEEFVEAARAKQIDLKVGDNEPTVIWGDADTIRRMLSNLLSNAIRYTDAGGAVSVSLNSINRVARLSIQDSGCGIPAESLPRIFDRFYRVDEARTRAYGGSGLGLAIVKAACDAHHAKITVVSEPKKGTRFDIVFLVYHG